MVQVFKLNKFCQAHAVPAKAAAAGKIVAFTCYDQEDWCCVVGKGDEWEYAFFDNEGLCIFHHVVTVADHPEPRAYAIHLCLAQMWYDHCDGASVGTELNIPFVKSGV